MRFLSVWKKSCAWLLLAWLMAGGPVWLPDGSAKERIPCLISNAVYAETFWDPFVPAEVIESDNLRQKMRIPAMVDLNTGTLNQLKTLPGFDEEIALKAMRSRPFFSLQDFTGKMPGLDAKTLARLVQQIQSKVVFNRSRNNI